MLPKFSRRSRRTFFTLTRASKCDVSRPRLTFCDFFLLGWCWKCACFSRRVPESIRIEEFSALLVIHFDCNTLIPLSLCFCSSRRFLFLQVRACSSDFCLSLSLYSPGVLCRFHFFSRLTDVQHFWRIKMMFKVVPYS